MLNEDNVDLEEIESRLYSLVYHSSADTGVENAPLSPLPVPEQAVELAKPPSRYFNQNLHKGSKYRKNNVGNQFKKPPAYTSPQKPPGKKSESGENISINQLVVVNPYKNIVCVTADVNKSNQKKANNRRSNKKKNKWKDNERKLKNLLHILTPPNKPKKRGKNARDVEQPQPQLPPEKIHSGEVITLSDSDNDDCVVVPKVWPCLSVADSDDDKTLVNEPENAVNSSLDEVVFIEPAPVEVISIEDEDTICNQSDSLNNYQPKDRSELLSTPESVSNDFIEPTTNAETIHINNFHMGLRNNRGEFSKTSAEKSSEICETGSSSSTTDVGVVKGTVFSEVEFPKDDIFLDANFETFGDFITPTRTNPQIEHLIVSSTPSKESKICKKPVSHSSDSSSESDYDETTSSIRKTKNLPILSHMHSDNEQPSKKGSKRSKKSKNLGDQNVESAKKRKSEPVVEPEKNKPKRNKIKKRKISSELTPAESEKLEEPNPKVIQENTVELKNSAQENEKPPESTKEVNKISQVRIKQEADQFEEISPVLEGFKVVDETFGTIMTVDETFATNLPSLMETFSVILSDTDSNLSPLDDKDVDIQLGNCSDSKTDTPLTSKDSKSSKKRRSKDLTVLTVQEVQKMMTDDPNLWKILDSDRSYVQSPLKGGGCERCRQFGHIAVRCPNKVGPIKCYLCGFPGHHEPRCPNKICTQCGTKGNYSTNYCGNCFKFRRFQCRLCGLFGHIREKCPDLWRRYHLTTKEGPLVIHSGPILKPKQKLWCSGCARSGHLEYTCKYYTPEYPSSNPEILDYKDVYIIDNVNDRRRDQSEPAHDRSRHGIINSTNQINRDFFVGGGSSHQSPASSYGSFMENPDHFKYYVGNPVAFQNQQFQLNQYDRNLAHTVTSQNHPPTFDPNYSQLSSNTSYFNFEDNLPNFLSFEVHQPVQTQFEPPVQPPRPLMSNTLESQDVTETSLNNEQDHTNLRYHNKYHVFFKQTVPHIQQFISCEMRKLMKLSTNIPQRSKNAKKVLESYSCNSPGPNFKTLNMALFGIFRLREGKYHTDKLRNFRVVNPKTKLTRAKRQALYDSYSYVFGSYKHNNVDYNELLMRI